MLKLVCADLCVHHANLKVRLVYHGSVLDDAIPPIDGPDLRGYRMLDEFELDQELEEDSSAEEVFGEYWRASKEFADVELSDPPHVAALEAYRYLFSAWLTLDLLSHLEHNDHGAIHFYAEHLAQNFHWLMAYDHRFVEMYALAEEASYCAGQSNEALTQRYIAKIRELMPQPVDKVFSALQFVGFNTSGKHGNRLPITLYSYPVPEDIVDDPCSTLFEYPMFNSPDTRTTISLPFTLPNSIIYIDYPGGDEEIQQASNPAEAREKVRHTALTAGRLHTYLSRTLRGMTDLEQYCRLTYAHMIIDYLASGAAHQDLSLVETYLVSLVNNIECLEIATGEYSNALEVAYRARAYLQELDTVTSRDCLESVRTWLPENLSRRIPACAYGNRDFIKALACEIEALPNTSDTLFPLYTHVTPRASLSTLVSEPEFDTSYFQVHTNEKPVNTYAKEKPQAYTFAR